MDVATALSIRDFVPIIDHHGSTVDFQLTNARFLRNGIIMFMSPKCIHCQEMSKEIKQLKKLLEKSSKVRHAIGTIDITDVPHGGNLLADYFKVVGVPTLMFHNEGVYAPIIVGRRPVQEILNILKTQMNSYGVSVTV
jgi:thioredoxin-related protein